MPGPRHQYETLHISLPGPNNRGMRGGWRARGEGRKEGVSKTEGAIEWRDDRLFYFPLPEKPFRTRARSIEDISQTSTGSLKYRHCRCPPHTHLPPIYPIALSLPRLPPSTPSSPSLLHLIPQLLAHNWKESPLVNRDAARPRHRFPAGATGISQVRSAQGFCLVALARAACLR